MYLYSASTNAFFLDALRDTYITHGTWPADAIEVADQVHAEFSQEPPAGKHRVAGPDGLPMWEDIPPAPPIIPSIVSMRQARLALLGGGLLQGVNDSIAAMPGTEGEAARIEWEYAQTVERSSALVQSLAATLPLTEQQLDDLFTTAASL